MGARMGNLFIINKSLQRVGESLRNRPKWNHSSNVRTTGIGSVSTAGLKEALSH